MKSSSSSCRRKVRGGCSDEILIAVFFFSFFLRCALFARETLRSSKRIHCITPTTLCIVLNSCLPNSSSPTKSRWIQFFSLVRSLSLAAFFCNLQFLSAREGEKKEAPCDYDIILLTASTSLHMQSSPQKIRIPSYMFRHCE